MMRKPKTAPRANDDGTAAILSRIGIFGDLDAAELKAVADRMNRHLGKSGDLLFAEGDSGDELYVVISGTVAVTVALKDGGELKLSEIGAGSFFGEMSLVERAVRSASCRLIEDGEFLSLDSGDFEALRKERPSIAVKVLRRMIRITAERLQRTNGFLSQLVQWGEAARKRAVTDEATGVFNRRFHDESFEALFSRSQVEGKSFSYAMFDLDRFGNLNKEYGIAFGDRVVVEIAGTMKKVFRENDIIVRYGGDEFVFLLPSSNADDAFMITDKLRKAISAMRIEGYERVRLACSIGLASFPAHASTAKDLAAAADKALYAAKEGGRNRVQIAGETGSRSWRKRDIPTIGERNRIIDRFVRALDERDGFLLIGHVNPDEDCLASLVSFGLLASKLDKKATIFLRSKVPPAFSYLLSICAFNNVQVVEDGNLPEGQWSAVVAFDTPKPSMLDIDEAVRAIAYSPAVLRMEVDHHLEADAEYFAEDDYRLVANASSACELVGYLAYKIESRKEMMECYGISELFTRNLVLAILTGIIGDSKMGKYLKTRRERWLYEWFSSLFDRMLSQKTRGGSSNFSSKEEVFTAIGKMSSADDRCYERIAVRVEQRPFLDCVVLDQAEADAIRNEFGQESFISMVKAVADDLAERNGHMSLVAYGDSPEASDLVQFRLRRSRSFDGVDLRDLLARFSFNNGGGHPGAVGFRIPKAEISDLGAFVEDLTRRIAEVALEAGVEPKTPQ